MVRLQTTTIVDDSIWWRLKGLEALASISKIIDNIFFIWVGWHSIIASNKQSMVYLLGQKFLFRSDVNYFRSDVN